MTSSETDDLIDRLYGLPLGEFTAARDEIARELRKAGRREEATHVKALRKPTTAAGAVNRLVREHRTEVESFLQAAGALRDAQLSGRGDLEAATRRERESFAALLAAGGEHVRQSLLAAAVDDEAARELMEARLERELEPRGFGTLLAHAGRGDRKSRRSRPVRDTPDDGPARARLQEAIDELRAAEAEERQAQRHWQRAKRDVEQAQAAADKARRDLDRLHDR